MKMYCFADIDDRGTNAYVMSVSLQDAIDSIIRLALDNKTVLDWCELDLSDVVIGERNEPQLINPHSKI